MENQTQARHNTLQTRFGLYFPLHSFFFDRSREDAGCYDSHARRLPFPPNGRGDRFRHVPLGRGASEFLERGCALHRGRAPVVKSG